MNLLETKIELLTEGFAISERIIQATEKSKKDISLYMLKLSRDQVKFDIIREVYLIEYCHDSNLAKVLQNMADKINEVIKAREEQNPNECQHEKIMVGTREKCMHCTEEFGERIPIHLNNVN